MTNIRSGLVWSGDYLESADSEMHVAPLISCCPDMYSDDAPGMSKMMPQTCHHLGHVWASSGAWSGPRHAPDYAQDMPLMMPQTCPRWCPIHAQDDVPDMPQMMLLSLFRHVLTLSANTWRKNHRWPHTLHMVLCWQKLSLSKFRGMSVFLQRKSFL